MSEFSENDWIEKLRNGDNKAFGEVFRHYYKGLCAYSYIFLKDHDASEEIVQDFFAGLWESQALRKVDISLKLYLYRGIHNKCINHLKSLAVSQGRLAQYTKYLQAETELIDMDTESDMYEHFFSGNFEKHVYEAIESLAPQQKTIFTLSRFQQKSYSEIARELDISVNTVKTQMSRALQKLRALLVEKLGDHPIIFWFLWSSFQQKRG